MITGNAGFTLLQKASEFVTGNPEFVIYVTPEICGFCLQKCKSGFTGEIINKKQNKFKQKQTNKTTPLLLKMVS